jgi:hypothetical protein
MYVLFGGKSRARSRLQSSSVELIDASAFCRSRGEATRDHNCEAVVKPEDSPVEEFVVERTQSQPIVQIVGSTEVKPTNMRCLNTDRSSV